ncbi:MAG: hypothetical protein RIG67_28840 [Rhodospirillales bacterium]
MWKYVLAPAVLMLTPVAEAAGTTHYLTIGFQAGSQVSAANVDEILSAANRIIATSDFPDDFPCRELTFVRKGAPEEIPAALKLPEIVNSEDQFFMYRHSPYSVNIVSSINWCGRFDPNFLGCAARPNGPLLLERTANNEGALWAHEFGHTMGLSWDVDATDHTDRVMALMRPRLGPSNTGLIETECRHLKQPSKVAQGTSGALTLVGGMPGAAASGNNKPAPASSSTATDSVSGLLGETWAHGLPYPELQKLTDGQIQEIRGVLAGEPNPLWPNAVLALGVRGNREDFTALRRVLEFSAPPDDLVISTAKHNVPIAVGYLAGRTGSKEMFDFLRNNYNPNKTIRYFDGTISSAISNSQRFAVAAAIGLAYSGGKNEIRPLQMDALKDLEYSVSRGAFNLGVGQSFFSTLREISAQVNEIGIDAYLAKSTSGSPNP